MNANKLLKGILGLGLGAMFTVAAAAAPAVVEKGTGVLEIDQVFFLDCFGEWVHEIGSVTYNYHRVQLPNGNYVYHDLWLKLASTSYGLESGHVWTINKNVSPYIERSTGGGMTHFTAQTTGVSETGPTIELRNVFHISFDANGELKVDRLEIRCWLRD
jgi:hypothetical protein